MNINQTIFASTTLLAAPQFEKQLRVYNVCIHQPLSIISDGIWTDIGTKPSQSTFTLLELQIIVIFLVTQAFNFPLKRLGFPHFVSQVMAGFLLGPSIPTGPLEKYKKMLFTFGTPDILNSISSLGYAFFLFLNSVQMDLSLITKTGKKAWVLALGSYFIPIICGFTISNMFTPSLESAIGIDETSNLAVVFISHSACSFAVVSSLLNDLGIVNSELGRLALSSAFVTDISGGVMTGVSIAIVSSIESGFSKILKNVIAFLAYVLVVPSIGRPAMKWIVRNTPEGRRVNKIYIDAIVVAFLLLGYSAKFFNQPFLVGAVICGLAVPEGPPLGSELVHQLEIYSTWFLSSLFVTCCTMKVDLTNFAPIYLFLVISCFIAMVHLVKLLLCLGVCRFCNMPSIDGLCLALILSCKGVVDICSYILVYDGMRQSPQAIGVMILSVLVLGTTSRFGVKSLYDPKRKYAGYQRRNIVNLKHHTELRIVACIQKPSHMLHIKNVLELCSPRQDNALVADVLHLMELIGRSTPIFIAHKLQQYSSGTCNYSGEIIVTFDLFEHDHVGSATVNTYTAISPMSLMHEDVCHLALDKNAAIIILPFHVKWGVDGSIELEDNNIRSLNSKVLERAPCSVGILVNRGPAGFNSTSYDVALIFLGGSDDREALCLAKRFVKNLDNRLFVYRLAAYNHDSTNWEHMIDDEELRGIRGAYMKLENVTYEEIIIEDASQTTTFIKEIANKFDFFIVGRRNGVRTTQTSALENWTEYSELGVIGDLLASSDMETKASILVVQQQQTTPVS
ncbi:hypothetical protein RJT34_00249 [Clitoria ternatea]|uniref:Cation/H+ exchanger domain-containing protein n=1 Tax=Clitoria ternatea TaxID=43366 RepID=A0AAN9KGH1_CLITE